MPRRSPSWANPNPVSWPRPDPGRLADLAAGEPDDERRADAGLAPHLDGAAHRLGQLLDDREAEAGADRPAAGVAGRRGRSARTRAGGRRRQAEARVLDREHARPRATRDGAARRASSGARSRRGSRATWSDAVVVAVAGAAPSRRRLELDAARASLGLVAAARPRGRRSPRSIGSRLDGELAAGSSARGRAGRGRAARAARASRRIDRRAASSGETAPSREPLGVAADRGQRRLQLVADREQERPLGLARVLELRGHLVERPRERGQLGRALDRHRLGRARPRRGCGSPRRRADRPRDRARRGAASRAPRAPRRSAPAISSALEERPPVGDSGVARPEQDEALALRPAAPRRGSACPSTVDVPLHGAGRRAAAPLPRPAGSGDGLRERRRRATCSSCVARNGRSDSRCGERAGALRARAGRAGRPGGSGRRGSRARPRGG